MAISLTEEQRNASDDELVWLVYEILHIAQGREIVDAKGQSTQQVQDATTRIPFSTSTLKH